MRYVINSLFVWFVYRVLLKNVDEIKWLVPAAAGVARCNSRDELKVFWSTLISRLGGGHSPALSFNTNVFSMQGGNQ